MERTLKYRIDRRVGSKWFPFAVTEDFGDVAVDEVRETLRRLQETFEPTAFRVVRVETFVSECELVPSDEGFESAPELGDFADTLCDNIGRAFGKGTATSIDHMLGLLDDARIFVEQFRSS